MSIPNITAQEEPPPSSSNDSSPESSASDSLLLQLRSETGQQAPTTPSPSSDHSLRTTPASCRLQKQTFPTRGGGRRFSYQFESVVFDNGHRMMTSSSSSNYNRSSRGSDASNIFSPNHTRRTISTSDTVTSMGSRRVSQDTLSGEPPIYSSRAASLQDILSVLPLQRTALDQDDRRSEGRISRQSFGQVWTKFHWDKVKTMEESASRSKRCSKLSSGFAPLMIFGGLVFVCIGVSALTNQSKDKERLKSLSYAPLTFGIIMLTIGIVLVVCWITCRKRSQWMDKKVLHGSLHDITAKDDELIEVLLRKVNGGQVVNGVPPHIERTSIAAVIDDGRHRQPPPNSNNSSANNNFSLSTTAAGIPSCCTVCGSPTKSSSSLAASKR